MTVLTFGIEMEMFIGLNKRVYQLIKEQISNHEQVNNIKQLIDYIYMKSLKKENPFKNYSEDTSKFALNLFNGHYTNTILSQEDSYIIILILIYIICNNKDSKYSFSLFNINGESPLLFHNCRSPINWYYDPDVSIQYDSNIEVTTYKTIVDKKKKRLTPNNHIPFVEFVSSVFNDSTEVKTGIDLLLESLEKKLKLNIFHSIQTSNHIHFSIKNDNPGSLGINDPKIIFKITYVFYVLQNLIYLMCLPNRRKSAYCNPLIISDDIDDLTINQFFDREVSLQRSSKLNTHLLTEQDTDSILESLQTQMDEMESRIAARISKINKTKIFSESTSSSKSQQLNRKQKLQKIDNIDQKLIKLTTINADSYSDSSLKSDSSSSTIKIIGIPFKDLTFNDKLTFLMHLYQGNTSYSYNTHLEKETFHIEPTYRTSRYSILNLKKLSLDQSCTLELRAKHGSNDSTEIKYFCELIEKIYNIAKQLDDNTPLLYSLSQKLNVNIKVLKLFKKPHSVEVTKYYESFTKSPLTIINKILKGLFIEDKTTIDYWVEHLDNINKTI
jgi:hypothetical protein